MSFQRIFYWVYLIIAVFHFLIIFNFCLFTLCRFFVEANNRLFKVLYEVASKEDRILTAEAVLEMGLDPYGDRLFIANIVDLYDIHVVLPDVVCC